MDLLLGAQQIEVMGREKCKTEFTQPWLQKMCSAMGPSKWHKHIATVDAKTTTIEQNSILIH